MSGFIKGVGSTGSF